MKIKTTRDIICDHIDKKGFIKSIELRGSTDEYPEVLTKWVRVDDIYTQIKMAKLETEDENTREDLQELLNELSQLKDDGGLGE